MIKGIGISAYGPATGDRLDGLAQELQEARAAGFDAYELPLLASNVIRCGRIDRDELERVATVFERQPLRVTVHAAMSLRLTDPNRLSRAGVPEQPGGCPPNPRRSHGLPQRAACALPGRPGHGAAPHFGRAGRDVAQRNRGAPPDGAARREARRGDRRGELRSAPMADCGAPTTRQDAECAHHVSPGDAAGSDCRSGSDRWKSDRAMATCCRRSRPPCGAWPTRRYDK